ncbi:MAG: hypothetical protein FWG74_09720, partial [Planctomycetes bacterium]|nr:hypothetical protein [Planctomycetota bacterium]
RELTAEFTGAFREYQAVLIETRENLPEGDLPYGFALLNPLLLPEEAFDPEPDLAQRPEYEYFQRWHIDYSLGRRRETVDYDRWLGAWRGYRGDPVVRTGTNKRDGGMTFDTRGRDVWRGYRGVRTGTNERDGGMAFDTRGRLAAVALTPRVNRGRNTEGLTPPTGFQPLDFIFRRLHQSEVFDPVLVPIPEDQGRRLIDFGVEYQNLDANTARLFSAASDTRGGRIGLMVTHVYPDSIADRLGIREHDILLRLTLDGKLEPVELRDNSQNSGEALFDLEGSDLQLMFSFMSPPWPARDNVLSSRLTAAGVGRWATIDYLRNGELKQADFETSYGPPDYRNARRERFSALGLTARPMTYEVTRYFRRPESSGVIVSRIEEGGKSSIAGLHRYILITNVNGAKVSDLDDFKEKVRSFESGADKEVELTVEVFGKTRLVKIE